MFLTKEDLVRIFLPTRRQSFFIILIILIIFLVFEIYLILFKITQNTIFSNPGLHESFALQFEVFSQSKIVNTISLVIFWSGVGLVSYSIIWSVYSFITEARNEVIVTEEYINKLNKKQRLQRDFIQFGFLGGIIALGLLGLNFTFSWWIDLWTQGILNIPANILIGILQIILGFLGAIINIYLFKVLITAILVLE